VNIDRKKFLDNIYINSKNFTTIEDALDDAEVDFLVEVRPIKMEKIKNIYLRRILMILLFPVYLVLFSTLILIWMPFLYLLKIVNLFVHLYVSMIKQWKPIDRVK